jgi:hypothetical protein
MGFELRFTDKEVTAWGGMGLMKRLLDHMDFDSALRQAELPQPGSNRGYLPAQLIVQFMLSIWCGANRFEHAEVTRHDPVLKRLFGFKRMANFKAIMRLFRKFSQADNERIANTLYHWQFQQLGIDGLTLDLDSTVMTRYGVQEGTARGYNPGKPGRVSHHPLMAFVADTRMIANCWLRPGNTASANNVGAFLDSTLTNLAGKRIGLLRADSGFSDNAFLCRLEEQKTSHIIALRLNQPLQRALVEAQGWWTIDEGIDLVSMQYQAPSWSQPRTVVGIRQHVNKRANPKGKTLSLFAEDPAIGQYRFAALVTNTALPAQEVWRTYRGRADCENRIKELKYDFAADSFCLKDFWATEASLTMVMLAYNFMSLFRQVALRHSVISGGKDVQHTLNTLRLKLFAKAGYIGVEGRKNVLRLAVAMRQRQWFEGVWDKSKSFDLPVTFSPVFTP